MNIQKNKIFICLFLLSAVTFYLAVFYSTPALSSGGCESDCKKCHTLNNAEVKNILSKIKVPEAKILDVQISPVRGLWEVSIENKGQRGLFYVDFSKKYVVAGQVQIIEVNDGVNKTSERLKKLNRDKRVDTGKIPLKNALIIGDKKAPKKIIVFTDPDCPVCGRFHSELKKVVEQKKDIVVYLKLFPLSIHPDAYWKSQSILCSKSLELLEANFANKPIPKPSCKTDDVDKNMKLTQEIGISATPTSILPDGSVQVGFVEAAELIRIIDSIKTKAGKK
ncbi:MAG: DsbC family protein [Nitrospiraceae bacterium]|nr:DsbC family protein [Nitrospiraceae bacterium]